MSVEADSDEKPIIIKKYANRRLYNTATSSYVTLDTLSQMVRIGGHFVVQDAKTGEDITRSVLTQIIVEEEQKGDQNLLPIGFLRDVISFYGKNMQWLLPGYLEYAMKSFSRKQSQLSHETAGRLFPFGQLEEMSRQNMAWFEQAMRMFSPFSETPGADAADHDAAAAAGVAGHEQHAEHAPTIEQLSEKVDHLQEQLESISRQSKKTRSSGS